MVIFAEVLAAMAGYAVECLLLRESLPMFVRSTVLILGCGGHFDVVDDDEAHMWGRSIQNAECRAPWLIPPTACPNGGWSEVMTETSDRLLR